MAGGGGSQIKINSDIMYRVLWNIYIILFVVMDGIFNYLINGCWFFLVCQVLLQVFGIVVNKIDIVFNILRSQVINQKMNKGNVDSDKRFGEFIIGWRGQGGQGF